MTSPSRADAARFPFHFGAQYYRAPTPEPERWESDLRGMKELGFTVVKHVVQWRWSHRGPERFFFDDLDALMDVTTRHGIAVNLNFFLDVSPLWLYDVYPDAKQVDATGRTVEPRATAFRQIGGLPGPCYRHPGALEARQRFVAAAVEHFRGHPAMQSWDVWNEPELCYPQRVPNLGTMACYCPSCAAAFRVWLQGRYGSLEELDRVWGRCYESWEQVEMPREGGTIVDFVDWREFHLDTMAGEAAWRLETVRRLDPHHGRYLHVVPNWWFSAVTCADDFAMAEQCEAFAATMNGQPEMFQHVISAARGRVVYNVESHVNGGSTDSHPRILELDSLLKDFLPQLGAGVKGILFWQYRPENLGQEAPAWGLIRMDGSPRPVTEAARRFWQTLRPHAAELRRAFPEEPRIGLWRSRGNEVFHFCVRGSVEAHTSSIGAYIRALYRESLPHRLINTRILAAGELEGLRLLILPSPYYLTQREADALDRWVRDGGVLFTEAHLGGYNASAGRHSPVLPGCGLAESWGIRESESTAAVHLFGDPVFRVPLAGGATLWGAHRYAELSGEGIEPLGSVRGSPCIARKAVGKGVIFYCGTNPGEAAVTQDPAGLVALLRIAADTAGIEPVCGVCPEIPGSVHLDVLSEGGKSRFAVLVSSAERPQSVRIRGSGRWQGLYTGLTWNLAGESEVRVPARLAELFRISG